MQKRRGVDGDVTGIFFLLVEGATGTICLAVSTLAGSGLYELSSASFLFVLLAGVFAFVAIMLISYTVAAGVAGVSLSIFNTNAPIQVLLSSLFLK